MRSKLKTLMVWYSMAVPAYALEGLTLEKFQGVWKNWSKSEKAHFHAQLLFTLDEQSRRVKHLRASRKISSQGREPNRAPASGALELCNYAGYLSVIKREECVFPSPVNLKPKDLPTHASKAYTEYEFCGRNNVVRCNPVLYGFRSEHADNSRCSQGSSDGGDLHLGCCVQVPDEKKAAETTHECNQAIFGENSSEEVKDFIASMTEHPERLAKYLLSAVSIINNCPESSSECSALKKLVEVPLREFDFEAYPNLFCCLLPDELATLGIDLNDFREVAKVLGNDSLNRSIDESFRWREKRHEILGNVISAYEQDPRTQKMVGDALSNAPGTFNHCYKWIKKHLVGEGKYIQKEDEWRSDRWSTPSPRSAVQAVCELPTFGFVNLADYGHPLDPAQAPVGSVIVYESVNDPMVPHGHAEIVGVDSSGKRRYISDHVANNYRTHSSNNSANRRRPVAIMVYPNEDQREELKKLNPNPDTNPFDNHSRCSNYCKAGKPKPFDDTHPQCRGN